MSIKKKKLLITIATILSVIAITLIIVFIAIFARGPRDYNEDGSILRVKNLDEVRIVLGDDALYLQDDFINKYARASTNYSFGVHFEGNLNFSELKKIPIKYNKKADGYRVFFDKPSNIKSDGVTFVELIINYRKHPSIHESMRNEYNILHTVNRAVQGQGWTLITVTIEDRYGTLEFTAKLDVVDNVSDKKFSEVTSLLIEEYKNSVA